MDRQLRLALVAGALAVIVAASHRYLQQPAERWLARTALTAPDDAPPKTSDIADRPTLFDRARRLRRHARFGPIPVAERVAGAASLAPIMIAVLRAGATGWTPEYDAGYFTARSLDVFTRHQPLVGAWSTLGATLNGSYNNLGPLQPLTLAPFTRIEPYWGTAVGVGVVNGLAVVTVWAVARRLFGPTGVVGVLLATTMLELSFGSLALVDPRQQVALILPFWALLWLTLGIMNAIDFAAPAWVLAASFVLQTHFSYAYMTVVLSGIGVLGFFSANRRRWNERRFRRVVGGSCALAVACWALPLWDQFFGSGNMGGVIGVAGGREPSGLNVAAQVLADSPLTPPFWLPPTLRSFSEPWSFSALASWFVVVVWIGGVVDRAAVRFWPTLFGYQFLYELRRG